MELLMVVVIVGILASMALPGYRRTVERQHRQTAQDILLTIYAGERAYFFANNTYCSPTGSGPACTWRQIYMDNPHLGAQPPVTYTVTAAATTFTATAIRNNGSGRWMSIDQNRQLCRDPAPLPGGDGCGNWPLP